MHATNAPAQELVDLTTRRLAAVMRHLMANTGRDFFAELERLELSLSQVKALQMLEQEPRSLGSVAEAIGLSLPAVSRAVEGLVKRELVTRTEDPGDRRAKLVELTPKGRRTVASLIELRVAGLRDFVESLTTEQQQAVADGLGALVELPEIAPFDKPLGRRSR